MYHTCTLNESSDQQESVSNGISAIVVLQWGRVGDHYGRKPVLLINIGGLGIAIICFGLSRTFTTLVLSKALEGLFKASRPTVKAAVAESSDESRMAFIFSLLPIMHTTGAVVGYDFYVVENAFFQLTERSALLLEEHSPIQQFNFLASLAHHSGLNFLICCPLLSQACFVYVPSLLLPRCTKRYVHF